SAENRASPRPPAAAGKAGAAAGGGWDAAVARRLASGVGVACEAVSERRSGALNCSNKSCCCCCRCCRCC
ncbi:unnamed protein product, partial [Polarella glacialis]